MNLFDYSLPQNGEQFSTLLEHKNVKIVRIITTSVPEDNSYCQDEDEWVVVFEGEATLEIEGKQMVLRRGDTLFIPAKTSHKILHAAKGTLWLAVHIANN